MLVVRRRDRLAVAEPHAYPNMEGVRTPVPRDGVALCTFVEEAIAASALRVGEVEQRPLRQPFVLRLWDVVRALRIDVFDADSQGGLENATLLGNRAGGRALLVSAPCARYA